MSYIGKICDKHPEVGGKRLNRTGRCVECHRETNRAGARKRHEELKVEIITYYGSKCQRCGEDDVDVLTIDHVNQDGSTHRAELGPERSVGSCKMYRHLKKSGFPPGFRVLCFNCNVKTYLEYKRKNRGIPETI